VQDCQRTQGGWTKIEPELAFGTNIQARIIAELRRYSLWKIKLRKYAGTAKVH
jgi:hypothetical protein